MKLESIYAVPEVDGFWSGRESSAKVLDETRLAFEAALSKADFSDAHQSIRDIVNYVVFAGGKRVRPVLMLLVSRALGGRDRDIMPVAAAVELTHTSSLIMDDIMDSSGQRRGIPSVHVRYGVDDALIAADYLIFRGLGLVLGLKAEDRLRNECILRICRASGKMIDGQFWDITADYPFTMKRYIGQISKRSGQFFECGAGLGALVSGASGSTITAMESMGGDMGIMFQLRDDMLDYAGDRHLGKPLMHDFRLGKLTAPVVLAIQESPADREKIRSVLAKDRKTADDADWFLSRLSASGAMDKCRKLMANHAAKAKKSLGALPDCAERTVISDLIDYLCYRVV